MSAMNRIMLNKLVNNANTLGVLGNIVEAPVPSGIAWEEFDRISQANMLASAIHTAYAAVVNANWREEMGEVPAFDAATDNFPYQEEYAGSEPHEVQTLDEAIAAASVVRTMVRSYSSDNNWLNGWAKLVIVRDENDDFVLDENGNIKKEVKVVRSFSCDLPTFFEIDKNTDQEWKDKIKLMRRAQLHIPYDPQGIDAVEHLFIEWLNHVPMTRNEDPRSRLERIAQKAGDKKWLFLRSKIIDGKTLDVNDLRHWVLIAYSPKFQADARLIRDSAVYKRIALLKRIEAEEEAQENERLDAQDNEMDRIIAARLARLSKPAESKAEPVQITKTERDEVLALIDAIPSRKVGLNGAGSGGIPSYTHR